MKRKVKDWLLVLLLLLDEAAAVVLVLLILWVFHIRIPVWLAIVIALLIGALAFIIHKVVIPSFHVKQVTGSEGMVGREGEVVEPLNPFGVIRFEGEYWKAKSVDKDIAVGESVEVLGLKKLVLEVRRTVRR
ncbi:NfeD family protein [Chloroflexota bacterium]